MTKWKKGDIVVHKVTQSRLMVLHVKEAPDFGYGSGVGTIYIVRLPDYSRAELEEFELEPDRLDRTIIKDSID